jgi:superfamily I DNA and/or RNA helicase
MAEMELEFKGKPVLVNFDYNTVDDPYNPHRKVEVEILFVVDLTTTLNEDFEFDSYKEFQELEVEVATKLAESLHESYLN